MLTGAGLFATLVGIRTELDGFPTLAIGLVDRRVLPRLPRRLAGRAAGRSGRSATSGCTPRSPRSSRRRSSLAGIVVTPDRRGSPSGCVAGACLAGQYVVAESWLNQLVTNANRGRILSPLLARDDRRLRRRPVQLQRDRPDDARPAFGIAAIADLAGRRPGRVVGGRRAADSLAPRAACRCASCSRSCRPGW